jgi:hypothetical protein
LKKGDLRIVVDRLGEHRFDDAKLVRDAGGVRQEFGKRRAALAALAALAVLLELELRAGERDRRLLLGHAREALATADDP